jgi:hypothetical protein
MLLGVVDLKGCEEYNYKFGDDPFATGPVCWILENHRALSTPIPMKGKQGLWDVPDELLREVL